MRRRHTSRLTTISTVALIAISTACGDDSLMLTVDVISDWEPGIDFVTIETELSKQPFEAASAGEIRQVSLRIDGTEPFLDGVRVAELDDVSAGRTFVRVSLRDATGRSIASRVLDLTLTQSFAATLLLSRSCRDVECPAPMGAPELAECQGGECVDPRCSPATPEYCPPPRCDTDAECGDALTWCDGDALCRRGFCLCRAPTTVVDAGFDAGFDGGFDAGFDAGPTCPITDCANAACAGRACDDGDACTTTDVCGMGACAGTAIACDDGNACTNDTCSPATGCVFTSRAEHATCGSASLRCCAGACVDINTNTNNCGGCGLSCNPGFGCGMRGGLPTCQCSGPHADCASATSSCSTSTLLCSCDPAFGGVCPGPMTCHVMGGGADVCTY